MSKLASWIAVPLVFVGTPLIIAKGCSIILYNDTINKPGYHAESFSTGIVGHTIYTKYSDGSQDAIVVPDLPWSRGRFHQDLDGDGLVDRIRPVRGGFKDILIRSIDYQSHKEEFDEADKQLKELIQKYPSTPEKSN